MRFITYTQNCLIVNKGYKIILNIGTMESVPALFCYFFFANFI